ncbi:DUF5995 family protein [Cellulomonas alba]|uniref:DUF5995 family protein n=1 Tax=Cellulomonas alba TaxID=3053467 RepID=A0ABT7SH35_9CELL|nr:DUF5995 family protein [Cellulomonas alba]MDM7855508.1 DUF5995 family protein [Cellulomonas alba]
MTTGDAGTIASVIARMEADLARLTAADDPRRYFHGVYLRTTRAVAEEVADGGFADPEWVLRWDVAFADLYLDALAAARQPGVEPVDAETAERTVSGPWRVAFGAPRDLPPLRHVLLGLNAHINYDLPQALLAVIPAADFASPAVRARREADHRHVDTVLSGRVAAEDDELTAVSRVGVLDRLLRPANRAASRRFLAEAREKVWHNATALDEARAAGPDALAARLAELERLCAARVQDLVSSRQVLLSLAVHGFGVRLTGA